MLTTNDNSYICSLCSTYHTYLLERIVHMYIHTTYPPREIPLSPGGRERGRSLGGGGGGEEGGCDALNAKFSTHFLPEFGIYCLMGAGSRLKNLAVRKNLQIGSKFGRD